jgi:hypothetical protein
VGRQVLVVVREPVGMGWEHEQKTQFLKRELKPVEHQVGIVAAIISRSRMSGFSSFHPKPDRPHPSPIAVIFGREKGEG